MKRKISKADFVRRFPARDIQTIVGLAASEGIKLAPEYIHNVRSADKARAAKEPKPSRQKSSTEDMPDRPLPKKTPPGDGVELAFKAMVVNIGLTRARALLTEMEDKLAKLVGRPV